VWHVPICTREGFSRFAGLHICSSRCSCRKDVEMWVLGQWSGLIDPIVSVYNTVCSCAVVSLPGGHGPVACMAVTPTVPPAESMDS